MSMYRMYCTVLNEDGGISSQGYSKIEGRKDKDVVGNLVEIEKNFIKEKFGDEVLYKGVFNYTTDTPSMMSQIYYQGKRIATTTCVPDKCILDESSYYMDGEKIVKASSEPTYKSLWSCFAAGVICAIAVAAILSLTYGG